MAVWLFKSPPRMTWEMHVGCDQVGNMNTEWVEGIFDFIGFEVIF